MNLVQISRSLNDFLSSSGIYENTRQLKALAEQNIPFPQINHSFPEDAFGFYAQDRRREVSAEAE